MDLHEAVSIIRNLENELGKIPTREEFISIGGVSDWTIRKLGWVNIIKAAGYDIAQLMGLKGAKRKPKLDNSIFEKDIWDHVENYAPREFKSPTITDTILVVGDLHFPFVHKEALEALYLFNKEQQPDVIIQLGDAYDMYAHSKYPRSQNIYSPKEEEALGHEGLTNFWKRLQLDNPKAKCVMLMGNHDIRPVKRAIESVSSLEHIVEKHLKSITTFDNVETVYDSREEYEICGILFHHGFLSSLGQHRDFTLSNIVVGHTHKGGVSYRRIKGQTLWELNAGFLGDPEAKVMSYTALKKNANYTLGWGWIDRFGPRFIHY
jgi:predicted phosphodiesterase